MSCLIIFIKGLFALILYWWKLFPNFLAPKARNFFSHYGANGPSASSPLTTRIGREYLYVYTVHSKYFSISIWFQTPYGLWWLGFVASYTGSQNAAEKRWTKPAPLRRLKSWENCHLDHSKCFEVSRIPVDLQSYQSSALKDHFWMEKEILGYS